MPGQRLFLHHGTAQPRQFPDYAAASDYYCAKRDASGKGASQFPPALLCTASGCTIAYISYNGRVWAGSPQTWRPGDVPLFTP